jgi:transposase-like protein
LNRTASPRQLPWKRAARIWLRLKQLNAERSTPIKVRQNKYLNNVVEQDHRAVKRIIKPMIGFKDFRCARIILSGIEIAHMIRKGQMCDNGVASTAADQFYSFII